MEGMLWKWTNYFSGWQPRWFVLDNGVLSYYSSRDDISNGCKGSMKISACDVSVHSKDVSRLDLIVPGEAHFYLKAATPQERQQWLIALGTAKACPLPTPHTPVPLPTNTLPEDELKAKKSELRIYCDLLMQQVHGVKCSVTSPGGVDVEQLNDSTSLLSATCDTFIQTLDDCVELAHAKFNTSLAADDLHFASSSLMKTRARARQLSSRQRSTSPLSADRVLLPVGRHARVRCHSETSDAAQTGGHLTPVFDEPRRCYTPLFEVNGKAEFCFPEPEEFHETSSDIVKPANVKMESRVPSFFTNLSTSFIDIRLTNDSEIPTVPFLDACRSGLQIFDKLNHTAFAPAKLDIAGNVKKVHLKYLNDTVAFETLQKMVRHELQCGHSHLPNSATMSLLWLNRSLQFINEFMVGFIGGSDDLFQIANTAYTKSLMPYHGWVVRGAFAMAIRSAPTRPELLASLSTDEIYANHPSFDRSVLHDMADYSSALSTFTHILHSLFENNNLNFADQV